MIRHLAAVADPLVDPDSGEISPHAPAYGTALQLLSELRTQIEALEHELQGKRLQIANLKRDREAEALTDPNREKAEFLHVVWRKACRRRRPLHFGDRERISRAITKLGLEECLAAVCGAAYDPNHSPPRRNGSRTRFDDLELIFREYANVKQFAERVPEGWKPDLLRLSGLGCVPVGQIEEWLGR